MYKKNNRLKPKCALAEDPLGLNFDVERHKQAKMQPDALEEHVKMVHPVKKSDENTREAGANEFGDIDHQAQWSKASQNKLVLHARCHRSTKAAHRRRQSVSLSRIFHSVAVLAPIFRELLLHLLERPLRSRFQQHRLAFSRR
jgi:hypothetical protein